MNSQTNSRLAIALDVPSPKELFMWAEALAGVPVILKIGLRLLPRLAERDFETLKSAGFEIFIDAKLHDIPSQVKGAVEAWGARGADYLTLHLSGGPKMLEESAQAAAQFPGLKLLGVSVLTSLAWTDLSAMGFTPDPERQVEQLVRVGLSAGIDSFVSSVGEVELIRRVAAESFPGVTPKSVCPGIMLDDGAPQPDQSRSYTVTEALRQGVSMLVMGRAILHDADPRERARQVLERLGHA